MTPTAPTSARLLQDAEAARALRNALRPRAVEGLGDTIAFVGLGVAFAIVAIVARLPTIAVSLVRLRKWGWIGTFVVVNAVGFGAAGAVEAPVLGYLVAIVPLLFSAAFLWALGLSAEEWAAEAEAALSLHDRVRP